MSPNKFLNNALSPWMIENVANDEVVLSSRIRLARNLDEVKFPTIYSVEEANAVVANVCNLVNNNSEQSFGPIQLIKIDELKPLEKRVFVEKHLISPFLAKNSLAGACVLSADESISVMINEEDHIRIQSLASGLQLTEALEKANAVDDWLESELNYAFSEEKGYLTSCPTNVGTGLRASVMIHLPALVMTQQMNHIVPTINQLGLVVRGIYGEGSEALGNIFQVSNQITLGKNEIDVVEDLQDVVLQLIEQEKNARETLSRTSRVPLEDRIFRSLGVLKYSRIIETKEAARCLSDVRLGIDMGYVDDVPRTILNELMISTQPGFLQQYAGGPLRPRERDIRRATLIRDKLSLNNGKN